MVCAFDDAAAVAMKRLVAWWARGIQDPRKYGRGPYLVLLLAGILSMIGMHSWVGMGWPESAAYGGLAAYGVDWLFMCGIDLWKR